MPHSTDLVFRLRHVLNRFPRFGLGPVDLELAQGRALGVVGRNGAGKSTLAIEVLLIGLITAIMPWRQGRKTSFV